MSLHRICVLFAGLVLSPGVALAQTSSADRPVLFEGDLLAVELNPIDQACASRIVARDDVNKDGILSEKEYRDTKLVGTPNQFDVNRNGKLTTLELAIYFANARRKLNIDASCCRNAVELCDSRDSDADQALSRGEYQAFPCYMKFADMDFDDDEHIDVFEIAKWLARESVDNGIHPNDSALSIDYVRRLDQDADRLLSTDEHASGIWPIEASRYDSDKDGEIDSADIAQLFTDFKQETGVDAFVQEAAFRVVTRFDKNATGNLDQTEFKNGRASPQDWESFDFNRDGHLEWFEIARRYLLNRADRGATLADMNRAEELLRRYDRNGNMVIEAEEALESRAGIGIINLDQLMEFDKDANQVLNKLELSEFITKQRKEQEEKQ